MRRNRTQLMLAVIIGSLALVGCAETQPEETPARPHGYDWVGEGEPTNFGGDYDICRRRIRDYEQTVSSNPYSPGRIDPSPSGPSDRREFRACMEGRGWKSGGR